MRNNGRRRRVVAASTTAEIEAAMADPHAADEEIAAAALPSNGLAVSAEAPVLPPVHQPEAEPHLVQAVLELIGRMNQLEARFSQLEGKFAGLEKMAVDFFHQGHVARETLVLNTRATALKEANETMKILGAEEKADLAETVAQFVMDVKTVAEQYEDLLSR